MKNITMQVGTLGNMKMDIANIYSDGAFEIDIPIKFMDDDKRRIICKTLEKICKRNGWKSINYAESTTSITVSFNNSGYGERPEVTYKLLVYAEPKHPDDENPGDEGIEAFELNLHEEEKKIFKQILLETITEQIMEG